MKDIYTIELSEYEFEKLTSEKKTVHLQINDSKHKVLAVGNQLTFVYKTEEETKEVKAVIENLLYFSTINEAVEIAKKFGGDDTPAFVNGILAKVVTI